MLVLVCVAGALTGCPQQLALWVGNGSTGRHLVFYVGKERNHREPVGFGGLVVRRCSADQFGTIMWGMEGIGGTQYADSVIYGVPSPGFRTSHPKRELVPGCYAADIGGTGRDMFDIRSDGSVVERAPDPRS